MTPDRPRSWNCWSGISAGVDRLSALLTDGELVSAHLVLTPERVVAAEAVRTLGSLALMGVTVEELIVNQVLHEDESYEYRNLPEHPAFFWYAERISGQRAVLDELDAAIGDVALVLTPHLSGEPIGPKALAGLLDSARLRLGTAPPGPLRPIVDLESGRGAVGIPTAATVAPARSCGADTGPGRRRPDRQRRRLAAPGSVGVGTAAVHRLGRTSAGR